jgi:hypothetical protein
VQAKNAIKFTATAADAVGLAEDVNRADLVALHNLGPAWAFLDFGQAANINSFPIPPGSRQAFCSPLAWHFITNGGNADLRILVGASAEGFDGVGSGEPTGAVGDPLQVETQQPAGNLADPVHVAETPSPPVLVGERVSVIADAAPVDANSGHALPTSGPKEVIAFHLTVTTPLTAATMTGTMWLFQSLGTAGWYPLRAVTLGNAAAVAADADQLTGSVAEVTWPPGVTRVAWQGTAESDAAGEYRVTITAR